MAPRISATMSLSDIQRGIARLDPHDLAALLTWLDDYRTRMWDRQAQDDLDLGRLDALLAEVGDPGDAPLRPA